MVVFKRLSEYVGSALKAEVRGRWQQAAGSTAASAVGDGAPGEAPREVLSAALLTASLRRELAVPTPWARSATDRLKSQVPALT